MEKEGKYIYGVIGTREGKSFGPIGIGDRGDEVYVLPYQDIAAVVSGSPIVAYDSIPRETLVRYLAAHQFVIEQVMKGCTIIPMKFGTIAQAEEEVQKIFKQSYFQLKNTLGAMRNKIELDVVASWSNLDSILKEIGQEKQIKKFKQEILTKLPAQTYEDRIKLGKMVKCLLDEKRNKYATEILEVFKKQAEDFCSHELMDDSMIMNAAFLMDKNKEKEFDQEINRLNKKYDEEINFRCVGPLPPYSFSTMEIKKMAFEEINEAKNLFGLKEEATISEIKETYRELARQFHPDQSQGDPDIQKRFEKITKAYKTLLNYCQGDRCSFKEEDVKNFIKVRVLKLGSSGNCVENPPTPL